MHETHLLRIGLRREPLGPLLAGEVASKGLLCHAHDGVDARPK